MPKLNTHPMKCFKFLSAILSVILFSSCAEKDKKSLDKTTAENNIAVIIDTTYVTNKFMIVNDEATLIIKGISIDNSNEYTLDLIYKNENILSMIINKKKLIGENKSKFFLDSLNNDYTDKAILKNIKFKFTRGSTLYFSAVLENNKFNKEIRGRFNLFYKTSRKGEIYGWITDEVNNPQ